MYVNTRQGWCPCHVFIYIHFLLIEKDVRIHFRVFVCTFPLEISSIFGKSFSFLFPYFALFVLW